MKIMYFVRKCHRIAYLLIFPNLFLKKRLPPSLHDKERWQATLHFLTGEENSQKPPYAI